MLDSGFCEGLLVAALFQAQAQGWSTELLKHVKLQLVPLNGLNQFEVRVVVAHRFETERKGPGIRDRCGWSALKWVFREKLCVSRL